MLKFGCGDFFSNDVKKVPVKIGGSGSWSPHCQDLRLRSAECSILGTSWFELIDRDSTAIPTIDVDCDDTYRPYRVIQPPTVSLSYTDTGCLLMGILCLAMFPKDKGFK